MRNVPITLLLAVVLTVIIAVSIFNWKSGPESSSSTNIGNRPEAQLISYDPGSCSTDAHNKLFVSFGDTVLAYPATKFWYRATYTDREKSVRPKVPNPLEPLGCPGNPAPQNRLALPTSHPELKTKSPNERTMLHVRFGDYADLAISNANQFKAIKDNDEYECKVVYPHIESCLRKSKQALETTLHDFPKYTSGAHQINPDFYRSPMGVPLVARCTPGTQIGTIRCGVKYQMYENLGMVYYFYLHNIPIDRWIEYDQWLRREIEMMKVNDYSWPS